MDGTTLITVTEAHCDELGHLNHVEAVRYLERARGAVVSRPRAV